MERGALRLVRARFTVDLHPVLADDPTRGLEEHLSTLLLRYDDDFDGVVLAFERAKVSGNAGVLGPYFPYVRVHASADLAVFTPRPGTLLPAVVHEVGRDFVAALALGFVNVTIDLAHIRSEFVAPSRLDGGAWVSRLDSRHRLEQGVPIVFRVRECAHQGQFMHILGSLEDAETGAFDLVGGSADPNCATPTATRRKEAPSKIEAGDLNQDPSGPHATLADGERKPDIKLRKHKSKRGKRHCESGIENKDKKKRKVKG